MRELAHDRPPRRVLDEEPHEPQAVVGRVLVGREEEVAERRRHGGDDRVLDEQAPALGNLDPFVDIRARVLAAHHVLGWRQVEEQPCEHETQRDERMERGPRRAPPEPEPGHRRDEDRRADVDQQQPREAVLTRGRHGQDDAAGPCDAHDDSPEELLVERQGQSASWRRPGSGEPDATGQEGDDERRERGPHRAQPRAAVPGAGANR